MRIRPTEILPLTGIRAFAAYAVLLTHYHGELCALLPGFQLFAPVYSRGGLGVDLFFILSGFIISLVYSQRFEESARRSFGPYLLNRFARIYPNYFAALLFLVLMVGGANPVGSGSVRGGEAECYPGSEAYTFWKNTGRDGSFADLDLDDAGATMWVLKI